MGGLVAEHAGVRVLERALLSLVMVLKLGVLGAGSELWGRSCSPSGNCSPFGLVGGHSSASSWC